MIIPEPNKYSAIYFSPRPHIPRLLVVFLYCGYQKKSHDMALTPRPSVPARHIVASMFRILRVSRHIVAMTLRPSVPARHIVAKMLRVGMAARHIVAKTLRPSVPACHIVAAMFRVGMAARHTWRRPSAPQYPLATSWRPHRHMLPSLLRIAGQRLHIEAGTRLGSQLVVTLQLSIRIALQQRPQHLVHHHQLFGSTIVLVLVFRAVAMSALIADADAVGIPASNVASSYAHRSAIVEATISPDINMISRPFTEASRLVARSQLLDGERLAWPSVRAMYHYQVNPPFGRQAI